MLKYDDLQQFGSKIGIHKLGVAAVDSIVSDRLNEWLNRGYHGKMSYMERNQEKRLDPGELLSGARSIISIFVNYHQDEKLPELDGVISKYARSMDYHTVLKDMLHELANHLHADQTKGLTRKQRAQMYRVFVDSAPVMEKHWATVAGIGWQGKHSNIITREYGSWGFLGEIITVEEFDRYSLEVPDLCGTCTACIDACPTQAITEPYVVDGSKCISYATIELDAELLIPDAIKANMDQWIFGCDICQDVCPWNRFAKPSDVQSFLPIEDLRSGGVPDFSGMDEDGFKNIFASTPLDRPGLKGLKRNQAVRHQSTK
ncbi:MAG: tRNA epoxyqueuosine(34) reductase QueG [FCB group bacterium]|nr:tRNA epoxyqueuosine(34) reductase QueG [FCB group bacterium]MBL7027796.1 tRNA epoxyqueuosine(34) reductase QueG [Candidatus Neomarinimicrobiota bacterium]MBL7120877.1 tRNA epoxyqueuosine(34) reductase QueG [Candidatus Neomarinimicrobiota bacterium]